MRVPSGGKAGEKTESVWSLRLLLKGRAYAFHSAIFPGKVG